MRTRCPGCQTHYDVDVSALRQTKRLAHCFRCGMIFDAVSEKGLGVRDVGAGTSRRFLALDDSMRLPRQVPLAPDLGVDIAPDLSHVEPSGDEALGMADALYEKSSYSGVVYGLLALLLLLAFGLQLAWQYRAELLTRFPQLAIICEHVPCRPDLVHAPEQFRVVERSLTPTPHEPGSLTLLATVRNDADIAQHLPDIQLSLLDNNGSVLVRRRLSPREYVFPSPPEDARIAPGEVLTIDIDFADPGHIASGFTIDFF